MSNLEFLETVFTLTRNTFNSDRAGFSRTSLLNALIGLVTLSYPFLVYFGVRSFEPRYIAGFLCGLLAVRIAVANAAWARPVLIAGFCYGVFAVWSNQTISLRFYPVVVNAGMLTLFALSLIFPPSLVERLARLQEPDLPADGVVYTRRVTLVWCVFFVVNGGLALWTAVSCSFEFWSLYNGLIAYLLMGLLFGSEYVFRMRRKKRL